MVRQLPLALLATALVVVGPPALTFVLFPDIATLPAVALCAALTIGVSRAGDLVWRRLPRAQEVLFADLMLWGWVRRLRAELALARLDDLLAPRDAGVLPVERRLAGLERLAQLTESRDAYTHRHSLRVTRYAEAIARGMGLDDDEVARVRTAAALHDVGKFLTPREILNKPGRLTEEEFAVVKRHPGEGASLLAGLVDPAVAAMVRHHHERLSGAGYPEGLAGEAIPLGARIIAVADTFDAMTSTRAYRSARSHRRALTVLRQEAGTELDAAAVTAFTAFYSGRRGILGSSLATGLSQALLPLRDVVPGSVARVLPALGASAALTAPVLTGGAPGLVTDRGARDATPPKRERVVTADGRGAQARPVAAPGRARHRERARVDARRRANRGAGRRPGAARPDGGRPGATGVAPAGTPPPTATPGSSPQTAAVTPAGSSPSSSQSPAATAAPTSAPTAAPEVAVAPVSVQAGDIEVTTPPVSVDVPDPPVPIPTVHVAVPPIKLP